MHDLVLFGKALADPTRVRILNALRQSELCVCELVDTLEVSQSTISTHLTTLKNCGLVQTEKRRTWIIYSIADSARGTLEMLFRLHTNGESLQDDDDRLKNRISLRFDGCCVVGSPSKEEKHLTHA